MKNKIITVNAIVAAIYVVLIAIINPFAFLANQFRIPEMLNHLIVFNKKYAYGIIVGVFIANLLFSPLLPLDLIYGVLHSIISLTISLIIFRFVKNVWLRMIINTGVFSTLMFIIAHEIQLISDLEVAFLPLWGGLFVSQFVVMGVGAIVMYLINKRIDFANMIE